MQVISASGFRVLATKDHHFRLRFLTKIPIIRDVPYPAWFLFWEREYAAEAMTKLTACVVVGKVVQRRHRNTFRFHLLRQTCASASYGALLPFLFKHAHFFREALHALPELTFRNDDEIKATKARPLYYVKRMDHLN
jgi:hypothetical protein